MTSFETSVPGREESINLQQFLSRILNTYQPVAARQNSLLLNDINEELWVKTDPVMLSTVICRLLNTVIGKCGNSCIRLTAKCYHNVVLFRINHVFTKDLGMQDLKEAEAFAATLGGCISLNTQARKGNAIILSFISLPAAA